MSAIEVIEILSGPYVWPRQTPCPTCGAAVAQPCWGTETAYSGIYDRSWVLSHPKRISRTLQTVIGQQEPVVKQHRKARAR